MYALLAADKTILDLAGRLLPQRVLASRHRGCEHLSDIFDLSEQCRLNSCAAVHVYGAACSAAVAAVAAQCKTSSLSALMLANRVADTGSMHSCETECSCMAVL